MPSPKNELFYVLPNNEFREQSDQALMQTLKGTQRLNSNPLSSLVNQLVCVSMLRCNINWDLKNQFGLYENIIKLNKLIKLIIKLMSIKIYKYFI